MLKCFFSRVLLFYVMALIAARTDAREVISLDDEWRFQLGENPQANESNFADDQWRVLKLPHDWSIEGTPAADEPSAADGGYFPTGVAWYRRSLTTDPAWRGKRVWLDFEGVAPQCEVWLNGKKLGGHHYAYTPFRFEVGDLLNIDAPNIIAVRVDNSQQPKSRWYTGSGIYRHVWLAVTGPVHVAHNGVQVVTESATPTEAVVKVETSVVNESTTAHDAQVDILILDAEGKQVGTASSKESLAVGAEDTHQRSLRIAHPKLWTFESPQLYTAVVKISVAGEQVDEVSTSFGIRTISLSAENGLLLNGDQVKLCGACVHHDNGPLGAAAFDRAEERRVELLKEAGFNAIRTAHNPPSTAFLNACDRLGMLVIDEAFDGWAAAKKKFDYSTVFADEWRNDLKAMIDRDRNHPSVIMWSIGNEVFERGNAEGRKIARELGSFTKQLDPTRPVAIALNGLDNDEKWSELDPVFASVDAAGYNYQVHQHAKDHERVPNRVIFCSESYARSAFQSWDAVERHPYVIGDFVWTGIDYLGEAGIGRVFSSKETMRDFWEVPQFPWHGGVCGDLDITGYRKPLSHYRQILWDRGEKLAMAVQVPEPDGKAWQVSKWAHPPTLASWTWPQLEGKPLTVEVYSRHPVVRLYLNGELIGEQPTTREQEFRTEFSVPYTPGRLRVVGIEEDKEIESHELITAGPAVAIRLSPDRKVIHADGQDLCFVSLEIVDDKGTVCTDANVLVNFHLEGSGSIAAVGNGDLTSRESYQAKSQHVYQGRALVVIRSAKLVGQIKLAAKGVGLPAETVEILAKNSVP